MDRGKLFKVSIGICILLAISIILPWQVSAKSSKAPIKLRYSTHNPDTSYAEIHGVRAWLKQIETATKGRVKFVIYPSQTLVKGADMWEGVKSGITDMGWCFHGYWPGTTPYADVVTLPALPIPTAEKSGAILWKLYEKYPELQAEYKDVKVLAFCDLGPYVLVSKEPVKSVKDFKGMKIRAIAGPQTEMIKAFGGIPILMPFSGVYVSLDKGVIDAVAMPTEALNSWKIAEVAKYVFEAPLTYAYHSIPMNRKKWNSLPQDIQKEIMSVSGLKGSKFLSREYSDKPCKIGYKQCKEAGIEVVVTKPSQEELNKMAEIGGKPIWKKWVKKMEANGYNAAEKILDGMLKLAKEN